MRRWGAWCVPKSVLNTTSRNCAVGRAEAFGLVDTSIVAPIEPSSDSDIGKDGCWLTKGYAHILYLHGDTLHEVNLRDLTPELQTAW